MKRLTATFILHASLFTLHAQTWDALCRDAYRTDTTEVGILKAEIDALTFFQNNEYSCNVQKGYTLPGAWMQPKLTVSPIAQIHLEAGAHLMFFDGANRYPNYAFHDITRWKGNQYQHGVHALPYLRAQADFRHLTLVLGDIYGAQHHQLILPLFNPEQNLSADPEMGFQLLLDRRHIHLDTWINWQSYIFDLDTHQEAFTVGTNATLKWTSPSQSLLWEIPVQLLIQHRGGEQDATDMGVQTLCNGSAGARLTWMPRSRGVLSRLRAEANVMGAWQQSGKLWPFETGMGVHCAVGARLWRNVGLEAGYVGVPRQFANLYGSPFFGTLSTKFPGRTFRGMHTAYASGSYTYTFSPAYRLGAQLDLYNVASKGCHATPFGFGVYLRIHPSFPITRKR